MVRVGGFFRGKTAPRILMLAALVLLAFSQLVAAFEDPTAALPLLARASPAEAAALGGGPSAGWPIHLQAYAVIVLLAFAFCRDEIAGQALFRRFGYWIALALIFTALSPGAPTQAAAAGIGGIAFLTALVAAIWHQLLPRMIVPPDR